MSGVSWLPPWARPQGPDPFLLRSLLVLMLAAGLLIGVLVAGLAAWEHGQRLLLTHHARRALEARDWPNALNYLQDVLRVHPHDLEATRLMAAFCKEASPRSYFEWLQRLQHLEPDNRTVSLELAQVAFRTGQLDLAEGLARGLVAQPGMAGPAQNLLALIAAARGRPADALAHFQSARSADLDDPVHLANLGAFLASHPGPEADAAWPAVLDALQSQPGGELAALRLRAVAAAARGRVAEALIFASEARGHPAHTLDDILLELNFLHDFAPDRLAVALAGARREAAARPGGRIALLEWTAQRRLWSEALDWIGVLPADLRQSTHVRFIHVQCALESARSPAALAGEWEAETWGEAEALRLTGAAEARRRAGDPAGDALRARALAAAEASPLRAFALLDLIENWPAWEGEEEILLQRLAKVEVFRADALHALFRLHQRAGSAARLLPVAEEIHRLQPGAMIFEGNWLALELLVNPASAKIHRAVEDFWKRHPQHPHAISLQAHALIQRGRGAEGAALFETLAEALRARPPIQLYYAHALARCGRTTEARRVLEGIDPAPLLDAERALLSATRTACGEGRPRPDRSEKRLTQRRKGRQGRATG